MVSRRSDGYHELRTIYQTIGLADRVTVECTLRPGVDVETDGAGIPNGPANLAYKAAVAFLDASGLASQRGARIFINKEIPAGGGLGGGSSNAATTLVALSRLTGVTLQTATLFRLARDLGADVPLFLLGGTILGCGRGDEVYALPDVPRMGLVVANPGVHVETASVFKRFSPVLTAREPVAIMLSFLCARRIESFPPVVGNDLETSVVDTYPEVGAVRAALLGAGAVQAWMTGSGASVVGIFEGEGAAVNAAERLADQGYWARAVETLDRRSYTTALGL